MSVSVGMSPTLSLLTEMEVVLRLWLDALMIKNPRAIACLATLLVLIKKRISKTGSARDGRL